MVSIFGVPDPGQRPDLLYQRREKTNKVTFWHTKKFTPFLQASEDKNTKWSWVRSQGILKLGRRGSCVSIKMQNDVPKSRLLLFFLFLQIYLLTLSRSANPYSMYICEPTRTSTVCRYLCVWGGGIYHITSSPLIEFVSRMMHLCNMTIL